MIFFPNDTALVDGCTRGCRKTQFLLYEKYSKKMYGVCLGYADDPDSAQDILQDGFIKVFENIGKFKGTGSLEGWIRRVIVNCAIDHYRKASRGLQFVELKEYHVYYDDFHIQNEAHRILDKNDFLKITQALPDGYRLILNLYIVEGMTHQQIADSLGISPGTSKSQFFKAKHYLRKIIHRFIDDDTIKKYERAVSI